MKREPRSRIDQPTDRSLQEPIRRLEAKASTGTFKSPHARGSDDSWWTKY